LTTDTYEYNCTNTDTYTKIHPIVVASRVLRLALTQRAKQFCDGVLRLVVIIVTLWVIVQTSMGYPTMNIIKTFVVTAATRSRTVKGEKRGDIIIIVV